VASLVALLLMMQPAGRSESKASAAALPAVSGAVDVVRHATGATSSVEYWVRESYPAPQTIKNLVDAMARAGWKAVEMGGFKSAWPAPADMPAADAGSRRHWPTHSWQGRWRGPHGREAVFRLHYSCPMEAAGMHSVWVHVGGDIHGPEVAARQEAARKRIREECRAGLTVSPECEE
jgi:hypothetical protein